VPFIIANAAITALVFGLFGGLAGATNDNEAKRIAIAGTVLMALLTISMSILYLVYGMRLIQTLTKTGGSAAAQSPVVKNLYNTTGW
jgi:Na+-driven multidrug efflux pump